MKKNKGRFNEKGIIPSILFPLIFKARQKELAKHTLAGFVADRTTFGEKQIQALREKTRSWDMAIASCGYALINGIDDLSLAFTTMKKQHPKADNLELYRLYGIL